MGKSLFIVLDGLDGSGKGEMVKRLHNYLFSKDKKNRILTTREPTYGKFGKKARKILKEDKDPMSNSEICLELYCKDREAHLKDVIDPFLQKSEGDVNIVICDRYYYSTIAFQHTQGIKFLDVLNKNGKFREPDISFILDLPVDVALDRIGKDRSSVEKFEEKEFMEKLRKDFLKMKDYIGDNIKIIDASKPISDVFAQIKKEIEKII